MLPYAATIFLGAFLLFQVQPLMGKFILPWFGGGPGIWTTCMLFFQMLLLGGYAYAHWATQRLKPRAQAWLHLGLLIAAAACLPIIPPDRWKPTGLGNPVVQILLLLTVCVGLPYFVLSSTGPLVQYWFHSRYPDRSPYRLYALSNIGSLLALLSFPFVFEPQFTRKSLAWIWGGGLLAYALACAYCAINAGKRLKSETLRSGGKEKAPLHEPIETREILGRDTPLPLSNVAQQPKRQRTAARQDATALPGTGFGAHDPDPRPREVELPQEAAAAPPGFLQEVLWVLFPAAGSVLLLATTNKLCQDVAVIPFLWVVPLSIYLLSFIICFDHERWYQRVPFTVALVAAMAGLCWALYSGGGWPVWKQLMVYCSALFVCCMVCHGEVYRLRPDAGRLTGFYLAIAGGGALGGCFVALAAPHLFTRYYELHWGIFLCALLFVAVCVVEGTRVLPGKAGERTWKWMAWLLPVLAFAGLDWCIARLGATHRPLGRPYVLGLRIGMWAFLACMLGSWMVRQGRRNFVYWRPLACLWLLLGFALLAGTLWNQAHVADPDRLLTSRNFYGVLTVYEHRKASPKDHHLMLQHGRITHGMQFQDPEETAWPTTYYAPDSGVGLALDSIPPGNRHIGVVGLGTGSLAVYAKPGDSLRIYEIDPAVSQLATTRFTYLRNCPAKVEVVPGDARLSMEKEPLQQFDFLALDAFSGDAIPAHLLTREAFRLYDRHLKPNGVIAVHISNHFLDLEPVVYGLAREFGYYSGIVDFEETPDEWWLYASSWVLLSHDERFFEIPAIHSAAMPLKQGKHKGLLWTDDFTSLFQILK